MSYLLSLFLAFGLREVSSLPFLHIELGESFEGIAIFSNPIFDADTNQ